MRRTGAAAILASLAVVGCAPPAPPADITSLLRAQGFRYLDSPKVTISPICSMGVGKARYDFYWYEWRQQQAPGALHAAHRLIQIRDGRVYDGHYGGLQPEDRPTCRSKSRELVFKPDPDMVQTYGDLPEATIRVAAGGLPQRIWVNGEGYLRAR